MSAESGKEDCNKPLFVDLNPDNPEEGITEVESLCSNCEEQGVTRLMLTKIPFFQEVILSSFHCDHCGYENCHVQQGGRIQDKGIKFEVMIKNNRDLNREVVKSEYAVFSIPHLDFEQPASKQGDITSVEGLIDGVIRGLSQEQPMRKTLDPELYSKLEEFIAKLENLKTLKEPFKIVIDDPTGNSFVENPDLVITATVLHGIHWLDEDEDGDDAIISLCVYIKSALDNSLRYTMAPEKDEAMTITHYTRTHEQDLLIGLVVEDGEATTEQPAASSQGEDTSSNSQNADVESSKAQEIDLKNEVLSIPTNCPSCNAPCETKMKVVDIPYFKQVVIMATSCDVCGNRENEVKGGSGIEDKGTRITLKVTSPRDLNRDVLKSDTCGMLIPEIDLELVEGTLGGRFTTVEGLLVQVKDQLQTNNPFFMGDSAAEDTKVNMEKFLKKLDALISGEVPTFTFILDDPAGNSYLQNLCAPDPDPQITIDRYTRSDEQNDRLGILHMKTENYTNSDS